MLAQLTTRQWRRIHGLLALGFGIALITARGWALAPFFAAFALADGLLGLVAEDGTEADADCWWLPTATGLVGIVVAAGFMALLADPDFTILPQLRWVAAWAAATGVLLLLATGAGRPNLLRRVRLTVGGLLSVGLAVGLIATPMLPPSVGRGAAGLCATALGLLFLPKWSSRTEDGPMSARDASRFLGPISVRGSDRLARLGRRAATSAP